eukprot:XP_013967500.1 UDP-GlcNAc:betaGal beta-1,3-N-acetylglucosaminyltransferase-like protein 1 [Canis lupus familiaris]
MELSVFNDASKDQSLRILEEWKAKLEGSGIPVVIGGHESPYPRGVGYSKNQAIAQSSGSYLCFLDSDDVMMPQRVRLQLDAATRHPTSIIGCQVRREPPDSTERYTRWINQLAPEQLLTQVFTSHGPTVVMPTWFCSRAWFSHVGPFDEGGQGVPEDLLLFYNHLRKGGGVVRVDQSLVLYRYHPDAATHSVLETTIWTHRVRFLEERVLPRWAAFTIWNAGRQGRRLYRNLSAGARRKVGPPGARPPDPTTPGHHRLSHRAPSVSGSGAARIAAGRVSSHMQGPAGYPRASPRAPAASGVSGRSSLKPRGTPHRFLAYYAAVNPGVRGFGANDSVSHEPSARAAEGHVCREAAAPLGVLDPVGLGRPRFLGALAA